MISNIKFRYIVIVGLMLIGALAVFLNFRLTNSVEGRYAQVGGDFTLTSQNGAVSLADFRNQVVLLFFGYASCPDYCPTELARISAAIRGLSSKELAETQGIFVSIDPARDTVEKVSAYATFFHENILGLTGTSEEVRQVADKYFAVYEIVDNEDSGVRYTIDHSLTIYLIGRDGQVAELIKRDWTRSQITQAIRRAL